MADTAEQFIDWGGEFHQPPWQANDEMAIVAGQTTAFDLLTANGVVPSLAVEFQGTGESVFVTSIGGVKANQNGNGYWWICFVNQNPLTVSCAAYKLNPGDSVAWDYKHASSGFMQPSHEPLI
jgi:hypothetical protein